MSISKMNPELAETTRGWFEAYKCGWCNSHKWRIVKVWWQFRKNKAVQYQRFVLIHVPGESVWVGDRTVYGKAHFILYDMMRGGRTSLQTTSPIGFKVVEIEKRMSKQLLADMEVAMLHYLIKFPADVVSL